MIIGIDASNVTSGGGLTHCLELLKTFKTNKHGIKKIIIWGNQYTLDKLPNKKNILKKNHFLLNQNFLFRFFWNLIVLKNSLKNENCDALLVLGGYFFTSSIPTIVMCQNMLCFDEKERSNFGFSIQRLKLYALSYLQKKSFLKSNGIIFLSKYAKKYVSKKLSLKNKPSIIIPHGIEKRFFVNSNNIKNLNTKNKLIKAIYISKVDMYKHQWNVVEAISIARKKGINIKLEIVGGFYRPAMRKLKKKLLKIKDSKTFVKYRGEVSHRKLHNYYKNKDLIIFASSCENLPIILLEGMATFLPIISSKLGPMPEILKKNAYYFNPYSVNSIYKAIDNIYRNQEDRKKFPKLLRKEANKYNWKHTSESTFQFVNSIIKRNTKIYK